MVRHALIIRPKQFRRMSGRPRPSNRRKEPRRATCGASFGRKTRVWKYTDRDETVAIETAVVETALKEGVPAYTGEIKIKAFRDLLASWQPDAISAASSAR
jgi:hypothetical protein